MDLGTSIGAVVAMSALLTACGGASTPEAEGAGDAAGVEQVSLGVLPLVDLAPVYLGQSKGFFEEQRIELTFEVAQGGAAIVPAVLSGQLDFGFSNPTSLIIGRSKGLPIKIVAPGGSSTGEVGADYGAVVVPKDSDMTTAADLDGSTVAVNTLKNIGDTSIRESVRAAGGDPDGVEFVELAFPDMAAALDAKHVDAVWVVEPFLTNELEAGAVPIAWNWIDVSPDLMASAFFTSERVVEENPDLVERFAAAMATSAQYAQDNPDQARDVMTTYTQIPSDVLDKITLPRWMPEVNTQSTQRLIDLAFTDGLIENEVAVGDLVLDPTG